MNRGAASRGFRVSSSALAAAAAALVLASTGALADDAPAWDGADTGADTGTVTATFGHGGASPEEQANTVRHWHGSTTNPSDGVTYGYNIVGFNPNNKRAATIGVDVIPLDLTVAGMAFGGSNIAPAVLASPLFANTDFSTAVRASTAGGASGPGGPLSAGNTDVQLLDATMRAEFDKVGTGYHVILSPTVHDPVALTVPSDQGALMMSGGHVIFGVVAQHWMQGVIDQEVSALQLDPTRLALFLTYDVVLFASGTPSHPMGMVLGAHGAGSASSDADPTVDRHGNDPLQTFVWASWLSAGIFNPARQWGRQDIHVLSHEIVEWANDPFGNNTVQTWSSAQNPQYGCSNLFETGDPVLNTAFGIGSNTFDHNRWSDGLYHPSDEALLPWFMRSTPETQASQSSAGGRLTFMGDLNPFGNFHSAALAC